MRYRYRRAGLAMASVAIALGLIFPNTTAQAQAAPAVSAFGANVKVTDTDVLPPTPVAAVATRPGDQTETVVDIPAAPVAVNGTLTATANSHGPRDIPSALTVVEQATPGPYHGRGLATIENAEVLYEVAGEGIPLLAAAAIRAEAAVICGATNTYTANSEIIDLAIGGTDIPVNAPLQDLIDGISGALADSGLNALVDVKRNVVTQLPGGGIGVDALVVTLVAAIGDVPLATIRLAHAEVTPAACAPLAQCQDGADNDGDGTIDAADPGCHSDGNAANPQSYVPTDNSEAETQCSDGRDNTDTEDTLADIADPGCHSDGNAANAASYVASDNNETDELGRGVLARTGGEATFPLVVAGLATLATLAMRLRRRITS